MSPRRSWTLELFQIDAHTSACACADRALTAPSQGGSALVTAVHIKRGSCGSVPLDNLNLAAIAEWPGPVLWGRGKASYYIDIRAEGAQRDALSTIVKGKVGGPFRVCGKTVKDAREPERVVISMIINGPRSGFKIEKLAEVQLEPLMYRAAGADASRQLVVAYGAKRGDASAKTLRVDNGHFKFDTGGYASYQEAVWSGTQTLHAGSPRL